MRLVWIGEVETSGKARDWLGTPTVLLSVFTPVAHPPTSPQLSKFFSIHLLYAHPQLGSSSFAPWRDEGGEAQLLSLGRGGLGEVPSIPCVTWAEKRKLVSRLEMEVKTPHFSLCFSIFRDQPNPLTQMCRV